MRRPVMVAAGTLIAVVVLGVLLPDAGPLTFLGHLLVGWVSFIGRVLPKIEVNWGGVAVLFLCLVLIAGLGHGFCSWLWKGSGHADPWQPRWTAVGISAIVLMFASGMAFTGVTHQTGWLLFGPEPMLVNNGRSVPSPSLPLRIIVSVQEQYRNHPWAGTRNPSYWREDIAGLYAHKVGEFPIKLLPLYIAASDDRSKSDLSPYWDLRSLPAGHDGYLVRALRFKDEKEADPDRYAACSFPASPGTGRKMYIVCQDGRIYEKTFECEPPAYYPDDLVQDGWSTGR